MFVTAAEPSPADFMTNLIIIYHLKFAYSVLKCHKYTGKKELPAKSLDILNG